jgi:hypothetical protein
VGTIQARGVRFRIYPKDHLPVHAHGKIGSGEVIVEVRPDGTVGLSSAHKKPVRGNIKDAEIVTVLEQANEFAAEIHRVWKEMQK